MDRRSRSPALQESRAVTRFNVQTGKLESESTRDGYRLRATRIGDKLGAKLIGGTVYELEQGQRICPYHYHHGVEEWVCVIAGAPLLRTPDGERTLRPQDVVCFPPGPDGAHTLTGPGRVLMLSANRSPSISVYPDSDKLGTRPDRPEDRLNFIRKDAVDYYDGE
jgi:uncharacterized cupin superfamily protein